MDGRGARDLGDIESGGRIAGDAGRRKPRTRPSVAEDGGGAFSEICAGSFFAADVIAERVAAAAKDGWSFGAEDRRLREVDVSPSAAVGAEIREGKLDSVSCRFLDWGELGARCEQPAQTSARGQVGECGHPIMAAPDILDYAEQMKWGPVQAIRAARLHAHVSPQNACRALCACPGSLGVARSEDGGQQHGQGWWWQQDEQGWWWWSGKSAWPSGWPSSVRRRRGTSGRIVLFVVLVVVSIKLRHSIYTNRTTAYPSGIRQIQAPKMPIPFCDCGHGIRFSNYGQSLAISVLRPPPYPKTPMSADMILPIPNDPIWIGGIMCLQRSSSLPAVLPSCPLCRRRALHATSSSDV